MYAEIGIPIFIGDFNVNLLNNHGDIRGPLFRKFMNDTNMVAVNMLDNCLGAKLYRMEIVMKHYLTIFVCRPNILTVQSNVKSLMIFVYNEFKLPKVSSHKPLTGARLENVTNSSLTDDIMSKSMMCSSLDKGGIDKTYQDLIDVIQSASASLPVSKFKPYFKPYLNTETLWKINAPFG